MFSKAKRVFTSSRFLRLVSSVLTLFSLLVVGFWLYTRKEELAAVQWAAQWKVFLLLIGMYGLSLILNFSVWHSYLGSVVEIAWPKDLQLYAYSNLSRRLPSGFGYFFVRAVRYLDEDLTPPVVLYFSAQELMLQVITGISLAWIFSFPISTPVWVSRILASLLLLPILFVVRPSILRFLLGKLGCKKFSMSNQVSRYLVLGWLVAYVLAWLNGGVMLHILIYSIYSTEIITLRQTLGVWTFTGSLGLVGSLVPLGQFARDASLLLFMQSRMPIAIAATVTIAFRFVLTVGDVIWSLVLWRIGCFMRN